MTTTDSTWPENTPGYDDPTALVCAGCGRAQTLTPRRAFADGWDAPPHFTIVVCCPNCLSAVVLGAAPPAAHDTGGTP